MSGRELLCRGAKLAQEMRDEWTASPLQEEEALLASESQHVAGGRREGR